MTVHGPLGATEAGAFELRDSRLNTRSGSSRTRVGMLGLSGLLVTGLVVSVSAAGTDSLLPEVLGGDAPRVALDASHSVPIGRYQEVDGAPPQ